MMTPCVVLCADTESLKSPDLLGLEGENLDAQPWLQLFSDAGDARSYLRKNKASHEVWVASSDTVDPINLAAALKRDSSSNEVYLLAFQSSGSLKSRASAAGLNGMLDRKAFANRYGSRKRAVRSAHPIEKDNNLFASEQLAVPHHTQPIRPTPSYCAETEQLLESDFLKGLDLGRDRREAPQPQGVVRKRQQEPISRPVAQECSTKTQKPHAVSRSTKRQAFILTIASAGGGAGKSTVAAISALIAQSLGHKTLLLDADLQFGDEHFLLGVDQPLTIDEVLGAPDRLEKLQATQVTPALLAAPNNLEQAEKVAPELPKLLSRLKSEFDVIVINTGSLWADQHIFLLEQATQVLFLIDQRPSSLRACRHALDLCGRCGIATHPFLFAVNRCARGSLLSSIDVSCGLQGAHVVELKDGGREIDELLGAGMPLDLLGSENALCASLETLLLDLLPRAEGESALPHVRVSVQEGGKLNRLSRWKRKVACLC